VRANAALAPINGRDGKGGPSSSWRHLATLSDSHEANARSPPICPLSLATPALPLAALALLLLAAAAQAGGPSWGGRHHGSGGSHSSSWLPAGISKDSIAAIRITFANGTTVDKPYPPPARTAADADAWKKKKEAWKAAGEGARPTKALVLKDGRVVALPEWKKPFAKEDIKSMTATFADGTSKTWTPGSGDYHKQQDKASGGGQRPTSVSIALKNGTTVAKGPFDGSRRQP